MVVHLQCQLVGIRNVNEWLLVALAVRPTRQADAIFDGKQLSQEASREPMNLTDGLRNYESFCLKSLLDIYAV